MSSAAWQEQKVILTRRGMEVLKLLRMNLAHARRNSRDSLTTRKDGVRRGISAWGCVHGFVVLRRATRWRAREGGRRK